VEKTGDILIKEIRKLRKESAPKTAGKDKTIRRSEITMAYDANPFSGKSLGSGKGGIGGGDERYDRPARMKS